MSIKCVIFDMGGVCVTHVQVIGLIARQYGIDPDALLKDYLGYDRPIMDGLLQPKQWWSHVAEKFHVDADADPLCELFHPLPNPPVLRIIDELREKKGVRLLLGSNTCHFHWQLIDSMVHLSQRLDHCYLSCDMHVSKPDPAFFRHIVDAEGVDPSQCLFVDDLAENIEGARQAGLDTFLFKDTGLWPADYALRVKLGLPLRFEPDLCSNEN